MGGRHFYGLLLILMASIAVSGCRTWGLAKDYKWSVKAPDKIERGIEKAYLVFTVETHTHYGHPVPGISYRYLVEWVGLHGWDHKAKSFVEEDIRVKGGVGTAYLEIWAYTETGESVEVIRHPFEVE